MDGAVFKGIPSTNVEVPVPPGWREGQKSLYTFAASGDGDAVLAFTTVSSVGEFAGRLQHATREFNITNCSMKDAERVRIGPNQLRGRLKEGDCSFNNVPAHVAVVLVESRLRMNEEESHHTARVVEREGEGLGDAHRALDRLAADMQRAHAARVADRDGRRRALHAVFMWRRSGTTQATCTAE